MTKLMDAMEGTLRQPEQETKREENDQEMQRAFEQMRSVYEDRVADLWRMINKLSAEKRTLFVTLVVAVAVLVCFVIYLFVDGMHGNWGFFQY